MSNISNKKTLSKIGMLMEKTKPETDRGNAPLYTKQHGKHVYGIFKENAKYVIKKTDAGKEPLFDYINGAQNKSKFLKESYQESLTKLNYMLSELKVLKEDDQYVMTADAPPDMDSGITEPADNIEGDVDMGDGSEQSSDEGFMGKYGEMVNDFTSAESDEKKWLLNSLISKLDVEVDADVISSATDKISNIGEEGMEGEPLPDDQTSDDGAQDPVADEGMEEVEEGLEFGKKRRSGFFVPYTHFANMNNDDYEELYDVDGAGGGFDGGDGVGGMGEGYIVKESLNKTEFLKKFGKKASSPFEDTPTQSKDGLKEPAVKAKIGKGKTKDAFDISENPNKVTGKGAFSQKASTKLKEGKESQPFEGKTNIKNGLESKASGDATKAKTIFTTYEFPNKSDGVSAFKEKAKAPKNLKEQFVGHPFDDKTDSKVDAGASKNPSKPYSEKIWGDNVVNGGTKKDQSIGVERYGDNKAQFADQTARDLTDPKKVQQKEKVQEPEKVQGKPTNSGERALGFVYPQSFLVKEMEEVDALLAEVNEMFA